MKIKIVYIDLAIRTGGLSIECACVLIIIILLSYGQKSFHLYLNIQNDTVYVFFHRWSQGLLFHQGAVDCARAALLLPLGTSILHCQPVQKCSLVETAFLLLVTVATVNMLTTVLNDSPIFPEDDESNTELQDVPLLMDSPQCVLFGTFMIWFSSITINLGPTFLSGTCF